MSGGLSRERIDEAAAGSLPALLDLFQHSRLSPTQRRIARSVLESLEEAAYLSSVELAARAGVSQPSVTRFAVAVGFSGYQEFRDALRRTVLASGSPAGAAIRRTELQDAMHDEAANVTEVAQTLGADKSLQVVARELAASRPLLVLGLRASAPLAQYFGYFAQRIFPDVRIMHQGGTTALDAVLQASATGGTWLLAFVMPRYPVETVQALRYARSLGLRTAVITDTSLVPFSDLVDVLLPAPVGRRLVFDSYAAPVVLAMSLLHEMAAAAPEQTQARLEAYEQLAQTQGLFCSD